MVNNNRPVALVMSGGGARGLAHIGVIERLTEKGYTIGSVAGTSMGSVVGAVYVSGNLEPFKQWVMEQSKLDILRLMDFAISKSGFIKGEKVFRKIKRFVRDVDIESLDIPFAAVAVDIKSHREVVFRQGSLIKAIRASVSIPTVLRPVEQDGIELVDGGVLNPLPLDVVHRKPDDILIAVDLNADTEYLPPPGFEPASDNNSAYDKTLEFINEKWSAFFRNGKHKRTGFFDLVTNSIYAMQMKLTQVAITRHEPDLVVGISRKACEIFEFHRAAEMIEYGKLQLDRALERQDINP